MKFIVRFPVSIPELTLGSDFYFIEPIEQFEEDLQSLQNDHFINKVCKSPHLNVSLSPNSSIFTCL